MYLVPHSLIFGWSESEGTPLPVYVRVRCPHCRQLIGFSIQWPEELSETVNTALSVCFFCRKQVVFVLVGPDTEDEQTPSQGRGMLYAYPPPQIRSPLQEVDSSETFSNKLALDYVSALRAYNLGEWAPAIASCQRALEEMMHMLKADSDTMLESTNEPSPIAMAGYEDLLQRWTSIIRRVHQLLKSDLRVSEPGREQATRVIDLVEYLAQCFFILPAKADALLGQAAEEAQPGE